MLFIENQRYGSAFAQFLQDLITTGAMILFLGAIRSLPYAAIKFLRMSVGALVILPYLGVCFARAYATADGTHEEIESAIDQSLAVKLEAARLQALVFLNFELSYLLAAFRPATAGDSYHVNLEAIQGNPNGRQEAFLPFYDVDITFVLYLMYFIPAIGTHIYRARNAGLYAAPQHLVRGVHHNCIGCESLTGPFRDPGHLRVKCSAPERFPEAHKTSRLSMGLCSSV